MIERKSHPTRVSDEIREHWRQNGPLNDKLRDVVDPAADKFRVELEELWDNVLPEQRDYVLEQVGETYEFPYEHVAMLPPALFGDITQDAITQTRELIVPEADADKRAMLSGYYEWFQKVTQEKRLWTSPPEAVMKEALDRFSGREYPKAKWHMAAVAIQDALKKEPDFFTDSHSLSRHENVNRGYDELDEETKLTHRPYETYVLCHSKKLPRDRIIRSTRDYTMIPVGEYGKAGAAKLARATILFSDFIKTSRAIGGHVDSLIDDDARELLEVQTARGRQEKAAGRDDPAVNGAINTLTEGVLTVAQVIALLTSERVEEFETQDEFIRAILESDIIEQFTRVAIPGYIGPTTLSGIRLHGPVEMRNGKPGLSKNTLKVLHDLRTDYVKYIMAEWALYHDGKGSRPAQLGVTCPAAKPQGGITQVKKAFQLLYREHVNDNQV